MFQSVKTIGIDPVTSMPLDVRCPLTVNVTDFDVPCIVSTPVACVEDCTPTAGMEGRTIGLESLNVAVGKLDVSMIRPLNWLSRRCRSLVTVVMSTEKVAFETVVPAIVTEPVTE